MTNPFRDYAAPNRRAVANDDEDEISRYIRETSRVRSGTAQEAAQAMQPEKVAKANQIARQTGLPPEAVDANVDDAYRKQLAAVNRAITFERPALREWASDPRNAAISQDDMANLARLGDKIERGPQPKPKDEDEGLFGKEGFGAFARNFVPEIGRALAGGMMRGGADIYDFLAATAEVRDPINLMLDQVLRGGKPQDWRGQVAGSIRTNLADPAREAAKAMQPTGRGYVGDALLSGVSSIPQSVIVAGTAAFGGPVGGAAALATLFGAPTAGANYREARDAGLDPGDAALYGARQASVEVMMESMPMAFAASAFGKSGFGQFMAGYLGRELPTELVTETLQSFDEAVTINPEKPLSEWWASLPARLGQTAIATLSTTGGIAATSEAVRVTIEQVDKRRTLKQAEVDAEYLTDLANGIAETKTYKRDPSAVAKYLGQQLSATGSDTTYINAEALRTFYQAQGLDPLSGQDPFFAWMDNFREQMEQAMTVGGEIAVPTAELLTRFGKTPMWEAIKNDIRLTPDGESVNEARARISNDEARAQFLGAEVAQRVAKRKADAAQAKTIYSEVSRILSGAGMTGDQLKVNAALWSQRAMARGQQLGVDPLALFLSENVRVERDLGDGVTIAAQPAPTATTETPTDTTETPTDTTETEAAIGPDNATEIERLARRYAAILIDRHGDSTMRKDVSDWHRRFAAAIVERRAADLSLAWGNNPAARQLFEESTGVKLPRGQAATRKAIYEWAGADLEADKAKEDNDRAIEAAIAKRNMAAGAAERAKIKLDDVTMTAREFVDMQMAAGFVVEKLRDGKFYLVNHQTEQAYPLSQKGLKEMGDYAHAVQKLRDLQGEQPAESASTPAQAETAKTDKLASANALADAIAAEGEEAEAEDVRDRAKALYGKKPAGPDLSKVTIVSQERLEEASKIIDDFFRTLDQGPVTDPDEDGRVFYQTAIPPQVMTAIIDVTLGYIEAGPRDFNSYEQMMVGRFGPKVRAFLPSAYEAARYFPGMDAYAGDMTPREEYMNQPVGTPPAAPEPAPAPVEKAEAASEPERLNAADTERETLIADFYNSLANGRAYDTIVKARKQASEVLGRKIEGGTVDAKMVEEAMEAAVVLLARGYVAEGRADPVATYRRLVDLYSRQPRLATRTSTSMEQQAYSTPVPLAWLASVRAGITPDSTVYEPTAGHGALLIGATGSNVEANELNPERFETLRTTVPGIKKISNVNAAGYMPVSRVERVIANPPFGTVKDENGETVSFYIPAAGWTTTQIDHAIAFQALQAMEQGGRAVLIVGGVNKQASSREQRSDAYNAKDKREFYYHLYRHYNVTDHFTVAGELYERQGAGWPVDVIVIEGRGNSALRLPAASPPRLYETWEALENAFTDRPEADAYKAARPDSFGDAAGDGPAVAGGGDAVDSAPLRGKRAGDAQPDDGQPGGVSGEPAAIEPVSPDVGAADAQPRLAAGPGSASGPAGRNRPVRVEGEALPTQVPFVPRNTQQSLNTLLPANMADAVHRALDRLVEKHGDLSAYVAGRLGYEAKEIGDYFSAEQIDALALSIDNMEKGAGLILGDQTGIGKGRVVAGVLRYAMKQGQVPIFLTEKKELYPDMFRDLSDIGTEQWLGRELRIMTTNNNLTIPLTEDGSRKIKGMGKDKKEEQFDAALRDFASVADVIFTTYSQVQGNDGKARRDFLKAIGQGAVLVLDESHNAGGTGTERRQKKPKRGAPPPAPPRSETIRELVAAAQGVMYSSATYAKRPQVMDLYSATDMKLAVNNPKDIGQAIQNGGVPLQQAVAAMLAEAGQYIRRERNFAGIDYRTPVVPVDRNLYDNFSGAMAAIQSFYVDWVEPAIKNIKNEIKEEAGALGGDNAVGSTGVESSNFTSIMHNLISQMLLSIKADAAADMAIEAIKAGQKPVLTLANTMGAFIEDYASEEGIAIGQVMDVDFSAMVKRYLKRTRRYLIKNPNGTNTEKWLSDADLGPLGASQYRSVMDMLNAMDMSGLPLSPIDHIRQRITDAGYTVSEITGRSKGVSYAGDKPVLYSPSIDSIKARNDFNSGKLNALILNQSGSTGISLHASETFKDQKPRRMIIVQAELNIDTHMQVLGRVNRTGQVVLPSYDQLIADIPAEKRPAAVLAAKMASLNANTTAARDSAVSSKTAVDFMNDIGGEVTMSMLGDQPDLADALDLNIKIKDDGTPDVEDMTALVRKFTGRLPLLPLAAQEEMFDLLEENYLLRLQALEAAGESPLEAKVLDLDAKIISTAEAVPAKEGVDSPFAAAVMVSVVDVKKAGKPLRGADVVAEAAEALGMSAPQGELAAAIREVARAGAAEQRRVLQEWLQRHDQWIVDELNKKKETFDAALFRKKQQELQRAFVERSDGLAIGQQVAIRSSDGAIYGVVTAFGRTGKAQSPIAFGAWRVRIAVVNEARYMEFSLNQIGDQGSVQIEPVSRGFFAASVIEDFDQFSANPREQRTIYTGNMLKARAMFSGSLVNMVMEDGSTEPVIMTKRGYDHAKAMEAKPVIVANAEQALAMLNARLSLTTEEGRWTIARNGGGASVSYLDKGASPSDVVAYRQVREIAGDFVKRQGRMMLTVWDSGRFQQIVEAIASQRELQVLTQGGPEQQRDTRAAARAILKKMEENKSEGRTLNQSAAPAPAFPLESGLLRAINASSTNRATGQQWLATLRKTPGVKAAELHWSGMEDILAAAPDQVFTREGLAELARENGVKMVEEVLGGKIDENDLYERVQRKIDEVADDEIRFLNLVDVDLTVEEDEETGEWVVLNDERWEQARFDTEAEANEYVENEQIEARRRDEDGIRERIANDIGGQIESDIRDEMEQEREAPFSDYTLGGNGWAIRNYRIFLMRLPRDVNPRIEGTYWSGHFSESNIVAHVRTSDRTTPDGRKVLFIEEVQSDWNQVGRDQGYGVVAPQEVERLQEEASAALEAKIAAAIAVDKAATRFLMAMADALEQEESDGNVAVAAGIREFQFNYPNYYAAKLVTDPNTPGKYAVAEQAEWAAARKVHSNAILREAEAIQKWKAARNSIPHNPFEKTWDTLAMKRMVRLALDEGYEAVAWTTGEDQIERYDLSEQVGDVNVMKRDDGRYSVYASETRLQPILQEQGIGDPETDNNRGQILTADQVRQVFGADIGGQIVDRSDEAGEGNFVTIKADDLRLGGEGMRAFYDKKLVNLTNDILKPAGARVEEIEVVVSPTNMNDIQAKPGFTVNPDMAEKVGRNLTLFQPAPLPDNSGAFSPASASILEQSTRGRIRLTDEGSIVTLMKNADETTFLHEMGHLWLEELFKDAGSALGNDQLRADVETVKAWFAANGHAVSEDGFIPTEAHEMWARGIERFLMEGKSPSAMLRGVFRRFADWLKRIYQTVDALNSPITPEIRQVMARLITVDAAIEAQIDGMAAAPLLADAEQAKALGMTPEAHADYLRLAEQAKGEAQDNLLAKVMTAVRGERKERWRAERDKVREQVEAEIAKDPAMVALHLLRTGKRLDGAEAPQERVKLSRAVLVAAFGENVLDELPRAVPPYVDSEMVAGGMHPDDFATMVGATSAGALVEALRQIKVQEDAMRAAGDRRGYINAIVEDRVRAIMDERHSGLLSEDDIMAEARDLLANERQGELYAAELRALTTGAPAGEDQPARTPFQFARAWARDQVLLERVSNILSGRFVDQRARASAKAGREAFNLLAEGDKPGAALAKQRQMVGHALHMESKQANTRATAGLRMLQRYAKRDRAGSIDIEYMDRIKEVLWLYGLVSNPPASLEGQMPYSDWLVGMARSGVDIEVPPRLGGLDQATWDQLSYEEFMQLVDVVKNLIHLGRAKHKVIAAGREEDYEALVREARQAGEALPDGRYSDEWTPKRSRTREIIAGLLKMEKVADWLDNGNPNGAFNRLLVRNATIAENKRQRLREAVLQPIARTYLAAADDNRRRWSVRHTLDGMTDRATGRPAVLSVKEMVALALNMGNESNITKMTEGFGWSREQVMDALNEHLTASDWQFVQTVWDQINTLWPEIMRVERAVRGVTPEKVEATPLQTAIGTISGGYYPVVYDRDRTDLPNTDPSDAAWDMVNSMGSHVVTATGHTVQRTQAVGPLSLSLDAVLIGHVQRVVTRIAYAEYVRDALRFLRDPRIRRLLLDKVGLEVADQFVPWIRRQVTDGLVDQQGVKGIDRFIRAVRVNTTIVALGLRWTTGMAQIAGLTSSANTIGSNWLAKGIAETARDRGRAVAFVLERSEEMARRNQEFDRDVADFFKGLGDRASPLDKIRGIAFWHIAVADRYLVAVPTWLGAYQRGMAEGMTEEQAAAYGDKAVRMSQGSGRVKDMAAVQAPNSEAVKLFTLFYSYFNVQLNEQWQAAKETQRGNFHKAAAISWWMLVAAPLMAAVLTGDWPDDDDEDGLDMSDLSRWAGIELAANFFAGIPGIRDMASYVRRRAQGDYADYSVTPANRVGDSIITLFRDAKNAATGEVVSDRWLKHAIETPGYFLGLPTGQAAQTGQFLHDVWTGQQQPETVSEWYQGLTKGRIEQPSG